MRPIVPNATVRAAIPPREFRVPRGSHPLLAAPSSSLSAAVYAERLNEYPGPAQLRFMRLEAGFQGSAAGTLSVRLPSSHNQKERLTQSEPINRGSATLSRRVHRLRYFPHAEVAI